MPALTEWSMQKAVEIRVDPFKKQFKRQVIVRRDMLLVMAENEAELKRFAVAVTVRCADGSMEDGY